MRLAGTLAVYLIALVFFAAAAGKFANAAPIAAQFAHFGLPHWFMIATGIIEATGALLMLAPRTRLAGGLLLCATMIAGAGFHFAYDPPARAVPAIALAFASALIAASAFRKPLAAGA